MMMQKVLGPLYPMETRKALNGKKEDGYTSIKCSLKNFRTEKRLESYHSLINLVRRNYLLQKKGTK
jgi:hypothetical protein